MFDVDGIKKNIGEIEERIVNERREKSRRQQQIISLLGRMENYLRGQQEELHAARKRIDMLESALKDVALSIEKLCERSKENENGRDEVLERVLDLDRKFAGQSDPYMPPRPQRGLPERRGAPLAAVPAVAADHRPPSREGGLGESGSDGSAPSQASLNGGAPENPNPENADPGNATPQHTAVEQAAVDRFPSNDAGEATMASDSPERTDYGPNLRAIKALLNRETGEKAGRGTV